MNTFLSTFLQAQPNAGVMQIILLLFIIILVVLIVRVAKGKPPVEFTSTIEIDSSENVVSNFDLRYAGFHLISAGRNLITAIVIIICSIPVNFILLSYLGNKINSYSGSQLMNVVPLFIVLNFIFGLVSLIFLMNGFSNIRKAGEKIYKK